MAEAVTLALKESPDARAARYAHDAAVVEGERDRPVARPTLDAVASGTLQGPRVRLPLQNDPDPTVLPDASGRVGLVIEQPLYRAGLGAARRRYTAELSIADQEYRRALAEIALGAQKAYLDVLRAESGLRDAQEGLSSAQTSEQVAKRQIEAGTAKPVDAATAAALTAEAKAGLETARGALKLAQLAFNHALGRSLDTQVVIEQDLALPPVPEHPDAAVALAQSQRPEIVSLRASLRSAQAGVSLARTQAQPTLSLRGEVTEQTPTALLHEHYAAATLSLRWPLLDAGKARLDTRAAQAQTQRLAALIEATEQGIELEVVQAWQRMQDATAQIALVRAQEAGLAATVTVAETAYSVGQGTLLEAQEARRQLRAARERERRATYDLQIAAADFAHAQGMTPSELALASLHERSVHPPSPNEPAVQESSQRSIEKGLQLSPAPCLPSGEIGRQTIEAPGAGDRR
jgi:outer membrane protein TolC